MLRRFPLLVSGIICCVAFPAPAEELYSSPASQCVGTVGAWMSSLSSSREIFVYFENDMNAEYMACSGKSGYQEHELQAEVEAAMETWNQEATGVTFHFGGIVPTGDVSVACAPSYGYTAKRPAVFVNFHTGCKEVGGACDGALATADAYSSDCGSVTLWGDPTNIDSCAGSDQRIMSFFDTGSIDGYWQRTMLHELGHILGLGHPADTDDVPPGPPSSMNNAGAGHLHLFPWDKDCVRYINEADSLGRQVKYNYMWWDVMVGDTILGGVRHLDGEYFLQRFVLVDPQRHHRAVPTSFVAGVEPRLRTACASKLLDDARFRQAVHAAPDVNCGRAVDVPERAPGEVNDETR